MSFYLLNPDDKGAVQMWKQALLRVHIRVLAEIFFKFNPFLLGGKVIFLLVIPAMLLRSQCQGKERSAKCLLLQLEKGLDDQVRDLWDTTRCQY